METNVKAYLQKIQAEFGMSNIVFHHQEPEWLVHNGKPTEIMLQKMCVAFNFPDKPQYKATTDSFDELLHMFETEFNHMSLLEQEEYIKNINSIFLQAFKELRASVGMKILPDSIVRFQFELFRWSSFWINIVEWRMTGKKPDFGLDLENINRFCANYLTPDKAVRFLQGELKRTITNYKFGSAELIKYKTELKSMLEDYLLLLPKSEKNKVEKGIQAVNFSLEDKTPVKTSEQTSKSFTDRKLTKPYLTTNEAMGVTGLKKTAFWKWIKGKKIEQFQAGARKKLYRTEDILREIKKVDKI